MGDEWPYLTGGRKIMLILALIGVGYLLLQTRQSPLQISGWNGNPFAAAAADRLAGAQLQGIVLESARK
jgi:hypothetical protein